MNLDGKKGFIGCQNYCKGDDPRSHHFISIPRNVKEEFLVELFQNDGKFKSDISSFESDIENLKICARVLPPRSGGKGKQSSGVSSSISSGVLLVSDYIYTAYGHIDENNQPIVGKISVALVQPRLKSSHRLTALTVGQSYIFKELITTQGPPQQSYRKIVKTYTLLPSRRLGPVL